MTVYLCAIGIAILSGIFIRNIARSKYGVYYNALMAIVITLISGLRHYTVGCDTLQFYHAYSVLGTASWSNLLQTTKYEAGYKIVNKLLYTISSNPQFFLFVTSAFIAISFAIFIYRYSSGYMLSWVIYITWFFPNNENLLRQSIAVSILLFGIPFLTKKSYIKYLLVVMLASLFHVSAIFSMLLPFIIRIKNKLLAIALFVLTIYAGIAMLNLSAVHEIMHYANYFSSEKYSTPDLFGNLFKLLIAVVVFLFSYLPLRKEVNLKKLMLTNDNKSFDFLSNDNLILINMVWIVIGVIAININIFDRLFLYCDYFMLIILPRACAKFAIKSRILIVIIIIALFITMFIIAADVRNYAGVVPYCFFWEKM